MTLLTWHGSTLAVLAVLGTSACGGTIPSICEQGNLSSCRARCNAGSGESCAIAAAAGAGVHAKESTELFLKGCLRSYAPACYAAGLSFLLREKPSPTMAARAFEAGCHLGHNDSCAMRAAVLEEKGQMPEAEAFAVFTKTCMASSAVGCSMAGDHFLTGRGVAADPPQGLRLLREACEHGEPTACVARPQAPEPTPSSPATGPSAGDAGAPP
jgi:TPR repeat protein